jgi:hypothetical protein
MNRRTAALTVASGILGTSAIAAFLLASREQALSVAVVLTSLYPAVPVLPGRFSAIVVCGLGTGTGSQEVLMMSTTPIPPVPPLPDPTDPDRVPDQPDDPDMNPNPEPEIDPDQDPDEQLPRD